MIGYGEYYYLEKSYYSGLAYIDQLYVIKKTEKNLICATGTIFNGVPTSRSHIALDDPNLFYDYEKAKAALRDYCNEQIAKYRERIVELEGIYESVYNDMYIPRKCVQVVDAKDIDPSKIRV